VTANIRRPPDIEGNEASPGGLPVYTLETEATIAAFETQATTLGSLPIGARLILRCRADWRTATVAAFESERVVLSVASPTGHTYRVRRPHDSALSFDGHVPILGEGCWRAGLARYDVRW
jgi:hypothetical protein